MRDLFSKTRVILAGAKSTEQNEPKKGSRVAQAAADERKAAPTRIEYCI